MSDGETLVEAALRVLNTADPVEKAKIGDEIANNWLHGLISYPYHPSQPDFILPDRPARLTNVSLSLTLAIIILQTWFFVVLLWMHATCLIK